MLSVNMVMIIVKEKYIKIVCHIPIFIKKKQKKTGSMAFYVIKNYILFTYRYW